MDRPGLPRGANSSRSPEGATFSAATWDSAVLGPPAVLWWVPPPLLSTLTALGQKNGCFLFKEGVLQEEGRKKFTLARFACNEKKFHRNQGNSYGKPGDSWQWGWQEDIRNMGRERYWKEEDDTLKLKKNRKKSVSRWDPKKLASVEIFFSFINRGDGTGHH